MSLPKINFSIFANNLNEYTTGSTQPLIQLLQKYHCRKGGIIDQLWLLSKRVEFIGLDLNKKDIQIFNYSLMILKHKKLNEGDLPSYFKTHVIFGTIHKKLLKCNEYQIILNESPTRIDLDAAINCRNTILNNTISTIEILNHLCKLQSQYLNTNTDPQVTASINDTFNIMVNGKLETRKKLLEKLFEKNIFFYNKLIIWLIGSIDFKLENFKRNFRILAFLAKAETIGNEKILDETRQLIKFTTFVYLALDLIKSLITHFKEAQRASFELVQGNIHLFYTESIASIVPLMNDFSVNLRQVDFTTNTDDLIWASNCILKKDYNIEATTKLKHLVSNEILKRPLEDSIAEQNEEIKSQLNQIEASPSLITSMIPVELTKGIDQDPLQVLNEMTEGIDQDPQQVLNEMTEIIMNSLPEYEANNIELNIAFDMQSSELLHLKIGSSKLTELIDYFQEKIDFSQSNTEVPCTALNLSENDFTKESFANELSDFNFYHIGNLILYSTHKIDRRIYEWYLPKQSLLKAKPFLQNISPESLQWNILSHSFAWALTDIIIDYGIHSNYHHEGRDEMHDQYTLPLQIITEESEQPLYYRAIITKDSENSHVYHRHLTNTLQDEITEEMVTEGPEHLLHYPLLGEAPLEDHVFSERVYGDGSYIDMDRSTINRLVIIDPKFSLKYIVPLYKDINLLSQF